MTPANDNDERGEIFLLISAIAFAITVSALIFGAYP